jgi:hypothetical protein
MKRTILPFLVLLLCNNLMAQQLQTEKYTAHNKGKFFLSWGGNRGIYTKSDISFKGDDYNFTLSDVVSHDKPVGWHVDYINPGKMTIPQTNARLGYFISDHYSIAAGVDHMKYVMTQNQTANISGYINTGGSFDGVYNNTPMVLTSDFLTFEHTDGLNYVNIEFSRHDDISKLFRIQNTDKFQLSITEGLGTGVLFPKTNAKLLEKERHDEFHVSGFGTSIKAGLIFTFFKHFYVQTELKGGYITMPNIRTTYSNTDKASQEFAFFERSIAFGGIFKL